jgi:hypothetical protein
MKRSVRRKEGENLDDATITKVMELLEREEPITKKEACELLNISYNTTRLNRILDEFVERTEREKRFRRQLRGKPTEVHEEKTIISSYLAGDNISNICAATYRSPTVVKKVLHKYNVPERVRGEASYFYPPMLSDEAVKDDYKSGDLVFAARYNSAATVEKVHSINPNHGTLYTLWVHGDHARHAVQPYYELADLRKAQTELEIEVKDLDPEEIKRLLYEAWLKSKKGKNKDE